MWPSFIDPSHLAPGDREPHPALPAGVRLHVVESAEDPMLDLGFAMLDAEFAPLCEMEVRGVIEERLRWDPGRPVNACSLLYRMMLLLVGNVCVAVRDHTAIARQGVPEVVIHMSHVLVARPWRRRGLATLLRTLPLSSARDCARAVGRPDAPVTFFTEMEPRDLTQEANRVRRLSYERAGFLAVGGHLGFIQPDFRPAAVIDADPAGSRPLPFDFLLRRVGREHERSVPAPELIRAIDLIYAMYATSFRPAEMLPCQRWLDAFRARPDAAYPLHLPTEAP